MPRHLNAFIILGLFLFSILNTSAFAVSVYRTATMGDADLRVALTTSIGKADVAFYRVKSRGLATGPYLVFFTSRKADADESWILTSPSVAQCLIVFVDSIGEAGPLTPRGNKCFHN